MRIQKFLLIILLVITASITKAQSLVMCESYDEQGIGTGLYTSWDIPADGGFVYLLYKQNGTMNPSALWYLYIDYDWYSNGQLSAYETLTLTPERGKNWIVYDYKFKDPGSYRAYIMQDGVEMASVSFTIQYQEGVTPTSTTDNTIKVKDTYYYEDSEVTFCSSVGTDGNAVNPSSSLVLTGSSIETTVLVDNNYKAFETSKVFVDVYKDAAADPYDSFTIDIQPDWDYMHFKMTFAAPGTYYVDLYTADDIFINTGTIEVTR